MSQTPCWCRIKKLKDGGIIRQIAAVVDREAVGLNFVSYAFVKLALPSRENYGGVRPAGEPLAGSGDLRARHRRGGLP